MGESRRRRQAERVVWASFSLSRESLNKNIFSISKKSKYRWGFLATFCGLVEEEEEKSLL